MPILNQLKPAIQQQIMWLHHAAFGADDVPCKPCGGACCSGCGYADGYLRHSNLSDREVDAIKSQYNFDPPKKDPDHPHYVEKGRGFLTDTGCSLPLSLRSAVCLSFICTYGAHDARSWTDEEQDAAFKIGDLMHYLPNRKGAK
jgi:hypothetical protein